MFLISINLIQDTKRRTPNENLSKRAIINSKLIYSGKINSAHEKMYSAQSFKAKVNSAQGNIQRRCILRLFACLERTKHPGLRLRFHDKQVVFSTSNLSSPFWILF